MSEGAPEPPGRGGGRRLFGLPRNVVIIGGVAFAGTILYLWWKNRSAAAGAGAGTQAGQQFTTSGIDYSGQLSVIQSEVEQLLQQGAPAGSSGGWSGGNSAGGGSWGGGSGGSSYGNYDAGTGSSPSDAGTAGGAMSGGTTGGTTGTSTGTSTGGGTVASGPPPGPTGGHVVSVNNNRAVVAWNPNGATRWSVKITGPGPLNGRVNTVTIPQASYSGLSAGHNYTVTVTPLSASGQPGPSGNINVLTTR